MKLEEKTEPIRYKDISLLIQEKRVISSFVIKYSKVFY